MRTLSEIRRYPYRPDDLLQGWNSADALLLEHLGTLDLLGKRILIVNDQFGALSCGLSDFDVTTYTDSYVSAMGILENSAQKIRPIHDLRELKGQYEFVVIQLPKNLSFFEDILARLSAHLSADSLVICGAMVKHLPPGVFDLLKKYIGETTTSLAQKKARLIFAKFERERVSSPYPMKVKLDGFETPFFHHSNLFSREKLDVGTRFFLEHIPKGDFPSILDLGCANGVVGIKAKMLHPTSRVIFSDDSAMAIESASVNYESHFRDEARFIWTNCFEGQEKNSLDLVLCNPPFHQGNTIGDFIAHQMFVDSFKALRPGGLLRVIGNTHLAYHRKLEKIFGNSILVSQNAKFSIWDARRN